MKLSVSHSPNIGPGGKGGPASDVYGGRVGPASVVALYPEVRLDLPLS